MPRSGVKAGKSIFRFPLTGGNLSHPGVRVISSFKRRGGDVCDDPNGFHSLKIRFSCNFFIFPKTYREKNAFLLLCAMEITALFFRMNCLNITHYYECNITIFRGCARLMRGVKAGRLRKKMRAARMCAFKKGAIREGGNGDSCRG